MSVSSVSRQLFELRVDLCVELLVCLQVFLDHRPEALVVEELNALYILLFDASAVSYLGEHAATVAQVLMI